LYSILDQILLLGDPRLHLVSDPVAEKEISGFDKTIRMMADTIVAFREKYGMNKYGNCVVIWQNFCNMNTTILMAYLQLCGPLTINLSCGGNKNDS
jgi:hypothetical protein